MEIRPPHKPNYPAIAELLGEALGMSFSAETLASRVMADQHFDPNLVFMAREKGEMLGFLATVLEGENAWVKLIAVHPSRRNQSLGREMLERAEERLFGEGARVMRAGFGPGPLFYPGVPEGAASEFFKAMGYVGSMGGIVAHVTSSNTPAAAPLQVELRQAKALIEATAPLWWSEVEERLTFKQAHMALSRDGQALCLAEPEFGIGPLFFTAENSADEAIVAALAIAGEGRRLMDFRSEAWWKARLALSEIVRCFEFQKDLRGIFHA